MREPLYKIVEELVSRINNVFSFSNLVNNGDGTYTFTTCNKLWAVVACFDTISSLAENYTIIKIEPVGNKFEITIKGAVVPAGPITIRKPFFHHGTHKETRKDLKLIDDDKDKFPMVYLFEVLSERFMKSDNRIERESNIRLFIMDSADKDEWTTNDHYDKAINPMHSISEGIENVLEKDNSFEEPTFTTSVYHANFGNYKKDGPFENIFHERLSGVELALELAVYRGLLLCTNCKD